MTKSLSGEPLVLDDSPVHGREVLVVDGNNLAHRAFHALPEAIATSWGLQSNALLGFANVFFKLLVDYKPRAALVAWDRKPVARLAAAGDYKAGRKPMASGLATQFPHFPEIVSAFGYPNVAIDGWEADDILATLAHQTETNGLRACLVSTDRDAFQLVSDRVCLMMTPRGVADVEVYTPERLFARYGLSPAQIPDFIALKGDSADNIAAVPGIGEKTAALLLAKYGSLEGVLSHTADLTPARRKALDDHADAARAAKALATLRRDLDLGPAADIAKLTLGPPDRSRMLETFRKFELKRLLERVALLDAAIPPAA
jgi:DNA polymerase I